MHREPTQPRETPTLDPGVTLLHRQTPRSRALHRLVVSELLAGDGRTLWIDAGRDASAYALYDESPAHGDLTDLSLARAFTAYQHHTLVERVVQRATPRTSLIVAPCTAALYQDDDVPEQLSSDLLRSSLAHLSELASALDIPVVITSPADGTAPRTVLERYADRTITSVQTEMGLRFEGPAFETDVYWQDGYWQTTIPYWVDLFGCVCGATESATPSPQLTPLEG